ncbi:MAG: ComF family protein [Chloroflexi bacterium]|nr:ComF family protein [Chloroflexota bacterium]
MVSALSLPRSLVQLALDAAFPGLCVGCGLEGSVLCRTCAPALDARLDAPAGVPIGLPGDIPEPLLQLEWCAPFGGVVREALHGIKYRAEQRLAVPLGDALARRWSAVGIGADLVSHVPVHADRARVRGYDQAELIAKVTAAQLGLRHATLLQRQRATVAQFDLDRQHRAANVEGAFGLARDRRSETLHGRWILLIDDVITTGATLAACAVALEAGGAIGVSAITVARER